MAGRPKPIPQPAPKPAPVPKPVPKPPAPPPKPPVLNHGQQSIYDLMQQTLASWGLTSLSADLKNLIIKGDTSPDTLALALSQTTAYKQRFAGNELRKKQGLPELSPAEYIATEEQYQNILRAYGLPKGFYDSHTDFTKLIGNDVSPTELDARAKVAHDQYMVAPPEYKQLWQQYGFTKGDAIASILDPNTATSVIQDRGQQVALGATALQNGFQINQSRAQQFQQAGVSIDQAKQAYQRIAQIHGQDQAIASRFGQNFTQADEENDLILGNGDAGAKRQALYSEEVGLFHGGVGSQNALGVNQNY